MRATDPDLGASEGEVKRNSEQVETIPREHSTGIGLDTPAEAPGRVQISGLASRPSSAASREAKPATEVSEPFRRTAPTWMLGAFSGAGSARCFTKEVATASSGQCLWLFVESPGSLTRIESCSDRIRLEMIGESPDNLPTFRGPCLMSKLLTQCLFHARPLVFHVFARSRFLANAKSTSSCVQWLRVQAAKVSLTSQYLHAIECREGKLFVVR